MSSFLYQLINTPGELALIAVFTVVAYMFVDLCRTKIDW